MDDDMRQPIDAHASIAVRTLTHQVRVGMVPVGGGASVSVQSMTNVPMIGAQEDGVPHLDSRGTVAQIEYLQAAGCEIVRVAIPNRASLAAFEQIVLESPLPVVADVHFDHLIAIDAAKRGASALRINPGNIGDMSRVDKVIDAAGEAVIPVRIGVNAGSLEPLYREKGGWTLSEKLVASAISYVRHFEERGFNDIVVSAKAHDVPTTIDVYRRLSREIPHVPLHIGITEAGMLMQGVIKSAAGLGILLFEGIGDTMRISLTADPVEEVYACWTLLAALGLRRHTPELISCPTCSRCQVDMIPIAQEVERRLRDVHLPLRIAVMGCEVNGPGEAADADLGIACGRGSGMLFANGQMLRRVPAGQIVDALFSEIALREKIMERVSRDGQ